MGDFRKKYRVYRLISREKILSWRLMLEKNLTPLYVRKNKLFHDRFGKTFFYTNQITHIPFLPLKSQMVGLLEPKGLY